MAKSKGWDWNVVKGDHAEYWRIPIIEAFYLMERWRGLGFRDFLDLGCGLGRHAILLGKNGFTVSCFDISSEAVEKTREWAESENLIFDYKVGDALELPYADESFDAILSYHVVNHTDTPGMRRIADEILRVLRPGGECYLTLGSKETWAWKETDWPKIDENTKLRQEDGPENNVPHFYADYPLVKKIFGKFEIVQVRQIEEIFKHHKTGKTAETWHYHILVKKPN